MNLRVIALAIIALLSFAILDALPDVYAANDNKKKKTKSTELFPGFKESQKQLLEKVQKAQKAAEAKAKANEPKVKACIETYRAGAGGSSTITDIEQYCKSKYR